MAAITQEAPREIVLQVEESQRRARTAFRLKFASLSGGPHRRADVRACGSPHNIDTEWIEEWWQFILIGAPITVLLSVVSILFATIWPSSARIGRLSRNPYLNGIASLYVSLVRGTPLLVADPPHLLRPAATRASAWTPSRPGSWPSASTTAHT